MINIDRRNELLLKIDVQENVIRALKGQGLKATFQYWNVAWGLSQYPIVMITTSQKNIDEKAEELADLLILIIGHSIAMDVNLEEAFNKKMTEIMKRPAIMGDLGIRVTNYES